MASRAVAMAICEQRDMRRASLKSMYSLGSKFFTSPAIWHGRALGSKWVTRVMPERPASSPAQNSGADKPRGDIAPKPVMTIRGR
jgi:hypothetical protein